MQTLKLGKTQNCKVSSAQLVGLSFLDFSGRLRRNTIAMFAYINTNNVKSDNFKENNQVIEQRISGFYL